MEATQTTPERLYRSSSDCYIAGVCGGLAEHFRIDPSIVRVLFVLLFFASGVGLLPYLVMWVIVPKRPLGEVRPASDERISGWSTHLPGIILIGIGIIMLIPRIFRWVHWHMMWPVILIFIGIALVFYHGGRSNREPRPY